MTRDPIHEMECAYRDRTTAELVDELVGYAKMQHSSFGWDYERVTVSQATGPHDTRTTVDAFVKEKTRNWGRSWVVPLAEEVRRRFDAVAGADEIVRRARRAREDERVALDNLHFAEREMKAYHKRADELLEQIKVLEQRERILREGLPEDVRMGTRLLEL